MDAKKLLQLGMTGAAVILLGGCSLLPPNPTKFQFPTPNWTMSKLFEVPTSKPRTTPAGTNAALPKATVSPTAPNCTNSAGLTGETVPTGTFMSPGSAFMKTWTLKNTGTCMWGKGYALVFDRGDKMGGADTIPLTASVPPGAVYTFAVSLVAPAADGEYTGYWKIQTPQQVRFGIEPDGLTAFTVSIKVTQAPVCAAQDRRPAGNGAPVQADFTVYPITIDGKLEEWNTPLPFPVTVLVSGESENQARFELRWDHSYLFLAIKVGDNQFVQETSGGSNLLRGDAVEILLDADLQGDYCDGAMTGDDYALGLSPSYMEDITLQDTSAYLWYPIAKKGPQEIEIAARFASSDSQDWILEAKIPWSLFGIAPRGGESYGFVVSVSDNDDEGTAKQEGIISNASTRSDPQNPTHWGTLQIFAG